MAFTHGKDSVLKIAGFDLSAYVNSVDIDRSVDMAETSTMGVEDKTFISGLAESKISIAGFYDNTGTSGPDAVLFPLVGSDTSSTWEFGPMGSTSGLPKYTGACYVTSYKYSAPVGDVVGFTAEFQVSGAVTKATYP